MGKINSVGILRNPAYCGRACYGKTEHTERQRITKPFRAKGGYVVQNGCNRETPREEWIEIPVLAIVAPSTFDIVQQRLKTNKVHSRRNTKVITLLQGVIVCSECGYSLYRTHTTTSSGKKIYYYRCFGSDAYRFERVRKCSCRPVRQDYLDQVVWDQRVGSLEDPGLIEREIEKRIEETKKASPVVLQKVAIEKQRSQLTRPMDKLLDAYQEGLVPISQLRRRMPELQKRLNSTDKEIETLKMHELALDQRLQLLDVQSFPSQLHRNIHYLDIKEKKKILRLLVKGVIVGDDIIDIKHSIPLKEGINEQNDKSYQLCTRSNIAVAK